jgi:thiosulfate dehydrogenase
VKASVVVGFLIFCVLAAIAAVLTVVFLPFWNGGEASADLALAAPVPSAPIIPAPQYLPPRIDEAPAAIRSQVEHGHELMTARTLLGDPNKRLTCSSCHFSGGLSDGGRNNGFSLVGVAAMYPTEPMLGLGQRISVCFRTNVNAPPPTADDTRIVAMEAYLRFISQGVPFYSRPAWLSPVPLQEPRAADVGAGERTWRDVCSPCHGEHGEGTRIAPATFGPKSFTSASHMLAPGMLERFIKDNMPRGNPYLDNRTAINVAAFVRAQPRPPALAANQP